MKKLLALSLCLLLCLSFAGCREESTVYAPRYEYALGEEIEIYTKDSQELVAKVMVCHIAVVRDTPFTQKELVHVDKDGDPVYREDSYEAIIKISYSCQVINPDLLRDTTGMDWGGGANPLSKTDPIGDDNFLVKDANGYISGVPQEEYYNSAEAYPGDNAFYTALPKYGEYVDVYLRFYDDQTDVARVRYYFGDPQPEIEPVQPVQQGLGGKDILIIVLGVLVVGLTVALLVVLLKKKKAKPVSTQRCKHCGAIIATADAFCSKCGKSQ